MKYHDTATELPPRTFFDCFVDHAKEPKCWKFIEALIDNSNGAKVTVGNVAKSATVLALEVIARVGSGIEGQGGYSIDSSGLWVDWVFLPIFDFSESALIPKRAPLYLRII